MEFKGIDSRLPRHGMVPISNLRNQKETLGVPFHAEPFSARLGPLDSKCQAGGVLAAQCVVRERHGGGPVATVAFKREMVSRCEDWPIKRRSSLDSLAHSKT